MNLDNKTIDKIMESPLARVPALKFKLFSAVNAYLCMSERNSLYHGTDKDLYSYCKEINSYLSIKDRNEIKDFYSSLSDDEIRNIVYNIAVNDHLNVSFLSESTDCSITSLAIGLLDIDGSGHVVADLGSGDGNVLTNVIADAGRNNYKLKEIIGYEINVEQAKFSQIVLDILSVSEPRPVIRIGNAFDEEHMVFTRGYCFPPFGVKQLINGKNERSRVFKNIKFTNKNTPEWLFIDCLLNGLDKNCGRAVAIVSGRALFNYADQEYREALLSSGKLEGIIELPAGVLNFLGTKPYMLVFSHNNKEVKIVDASDKIVSDKYNKYTKNRISVGEVLAMYTDFIALTKTIEELKDFGNLTPSSILLELGKPRNGKPLHELADVFTGNQYTLGVFEKNGQISKEPTGYRILTSSDIEDGLVNWNSLTSINYNDTKFDKYAVRKDDIILTSKSSKVKTVVVDIDPKEKILVTGGMLIVRPNINLLNPFYFKAFIDSKQGQETLKSIQKGSVITTINAKDLANILVPVIDIDKQRIKAFRYNDKLSTLYALKQEVKRLEESIKNFYSDESEEE